ncbi:MAG: PD40 domain-containing protein [Caldilineales bacterium]|nr:PD40 domain-containing protein [Caldilineales bacterium]
MTSPDPKNNGINVPTIVLGVAILAFACVICGTGLALMETLTPIKPFTTFFARAFGGEVSGQNRAGEVIDISQAATFTPTITPIPSDTPTPEPTATATDTPTPTDTPLPTSTDTPIPPTDTPTPPEPPTDTPTPTVTSTPTNTITPTATNTRPPNRTATAVAAATAAAQPTATPRPIQAARLSGKLAFPVFDPSSGTYSVQMANADGSGLRTLIDEASAPALSPNGQQIVFRRWKNDERGLEVMNLGGGGFQRLTTYLEDGSATWSNDGGNLAFFSRRESDRQPRVYRYGLHSGGEQVITQNFAAVYGQMPSFLPDGRIVYRATFPELGIGLMNGDGSNFRLLAADGSATTPVASPDGRFIVFMTARDGNWELYRVGVDGSGLRRLTNNGSSDGQPAWSPDGSSIAFTSDRGGQWAIWAMNADGSNQRQLFVLPGPPGGRVSGEPEFVGLGWEEERISWSR